MDVDRGFYPRNAFIDRRFNPRAAARACKRLSALFPEREPFVASEGSSTEEIPFKQFEPEAPACLRSPDEGGGAARIAAWRYRRSGFDCGTIGIGVIVPKLAGEDFLQR